MVVFVTGPDGVLGSNLTRELLERKYEVHVLVEKGKNPVTLRNLPISVHHGNILDADLLNDLFKGKDIVFHCAALTSMFPAKSEMVRKVNIEGTQNVINACIKNNVKRLINVSSATAFGCGTTLDNLGNECNPYTNAKYGLDYHYSKYEAQRLVLEATQKRNLQAIVVNPTFMIGPYDSKPSSGLMVISVARGKVPGYSSGGKNYVSVKDVAVAMANAITMGRVGECYILGNQNLSYKEAFATIAKVVGVPPPTRRFPDAMVKFYGSLSSLGARIFRYYPAMTRELAEISIENQYYSSTKAQEELQMPQTPIEVAIKECYDWFIENGYLKK